MRIIAGSLKGRLFHDPPGRRAHPMSEKARGGLFNALGDIEGLSVLDAFAGSGALAFEALSRGASRALAIELDKPLHSNILKNIRMLGLDGRLKAVRANAGGWSNNNPGSKFDVVLLDPPYDNLQIRLLSRLAGHAKSGGIIVVSWPGRETLPEFDNCRLAANKDYGDAQLAFYRKV